MAIKLYNTLIRSKRRPWTTRQMASTRILGQLAMLALVTTVATPPATAEANRITIAADKPIWLAVTRPTFAKALEPLAKKRRQDGFEAIVSVRPVAEAIAALGRRADMLLLVGDDEPGKDAEAWYLPAKREDLYRWRVEQDRKFASDAAWGDFDGDNVPDIPVGRFLSHIIRDF